MLSSLCASLELWLNDRCPPGLPGELERIRDFNYHFPAAEGRGQMVHVCAEEEENRGGAHSDQGGFA